MSDWQFHRLVRNFLQILLVKPANKQKKPLARRLIGSKRAYANGAAAARSKQTTTDAIAITRVDETVGIAQLSPRQRAAVHLLVEGLSYREISERLGISLFTVRSHLHSAYKRLQVKSRGQAVARLLRETSQSPGALHGKAPGPRSGESPKRSYKIDNLFNADIPLSSSYAART